MKAHSITFLIAALGLASKVAAHPPLLSRAIGDSCKAPEGSGTCQTTAACKGISYPQNLCPKDPQNIQCCVTISCSASAGKGFCRSVKNNGCAGGSFVSGVCPGDNDIQCCIKPTDAPAPPRQTPTTPKSTSAPKPSPKPATANGRLPAYALTHLKGLEGVRKTFYIDSTGHRTIGVGHNCDAHPGTCNNLKTPLTDAEVDRLLREDVRIFEKCVCKLPNAEKLNANQFSALVSYAFNSGCGGVERDFKAEMQSSAFTKICNDLPTTNTLNGLLTSRRTKEKELCLRATKTKSGC